MAGNKMNRRGSSPIWFVMLIVVIFVLYSVTVALSTAEDCGSNPKSWTVFPPGWECKTNPGYG